MQAYRHHERSRESIELAFEKILKTSLKNREKFGFQPPKTGRRSDRKGVELVQSSDSAFLAQISIYSNFID